MITSTPNSLDNLFFNNWVSMPETPFSQIVIDGKCNIYVNAVGLDKEDISIEVVDGQLKIKGENKNQNITFLHGIDIVFKPNDIWDYEKIEAKLDKGILELIIEPMDKPKTKIEIK